MERFRRNLDGVVLLTLSRNPRELDVALLGSSAAFAAWATQEDPVDELDLARLVDDQAQRLCYGVFLRSMYASCTSDVKAVSSWRIILQPGCWP